MNEERWRALIGGFGAAALCWGVAGVVHVGLVHHSRGAGHPGTWGLPEGNVQYDIAVVLGVLVTLYSVPGLLRRKAWWPSLALSLGCGVGAVSVLTLGREPRYWAAASIMTAAGVAAPLAQRFWGRSNPT